MDRRVTPTVTLVDVSRDAGEAGVVGRREGVR